MDQTEILNRDIAQLDGWTDLNWEPGTIGRDYRTLAGWYGNGPDGAHYLQSDRYYTNNCERALRVALKIAPSECHFRQEGRKIIFELRVNGAIYVGEAEYPAPAICAALHKFIHGE